MLVVEEEKLQRTEEVGRKMTRKSVGVEAAKWGVFSVLWLVFNINNPIVGVAGWPGWQCATLFPSLCN